MAGIPPPLAALLQDITAGFPLLLGRSLLGIYLYGSITQRAFNPRCSDVDGIVVTRRGLSPRQFERLQSWLVQARQSGDWAARLQLSFLVRDRLLKADPRACLWQFGALTHSGSDGNPIIWLNVLKSGRTLYGPPPESFVPPITREALFAALLRELNYLREEICGEQSEWRGKPSYQAYAVLTVCRILYSFHKNTVVSKPVAARWGLRSLPGQWHGLIRRALDSSRSATQAGIPLARIAAFIDFAETRLCGG